MIMDIIHKNIIQRNHCEILNNCNFRSLLPKLVKHNVFTQNMIRDYEKCDNESKVRLLFDLLTRGPKAFDNFIIALNETNQTYLSSKLLGKEDRTFITNEHSSSNTYNQILTSNEPLHQRTDRLVIRVDLSTEFNDDPNSVTNPYYMRSKKRGVVLIINNKDFNFKRKRSGAEMDQTNLEDLFRQFGGYTIITKEDRNSTVEFLNNYTARSKIILIKEMGNDNKELSGNEILKDVDIMFIFIMSHGYSDSGKESYIECKNGDYVAASYIESYFTNENCSAMKGKPKVIVYQICRGLNRERAVSTTETDGTLIRKHADMLICHSTVQGCIAHRDIELGCWYIHTLCEVFMQYAKSFHLEDLFHMVDRSLSHWQSDDRHLSMQTTDFKNIGFRHCFLNPGIYEEDNFLLHYSTD